MTAWKDSTSYSRNQVDRTPTSFTTEAGNIRITVVKTHRMNPGFWSVHCPALSMDTVDTKLPDTVAAETAQTCAVNMVANKLSVMLRDVRRLM